MPVVFIVRHPIATSLSRLRSDSFHGLGDYLATPAGREDAEGSPVAAWLPLYDSHRADPDPLVRLVAEWCIENVYPLNRARDAGPAPVFYENLVLDPIAELDGLAELCRDALGPVQAPLTINEARKPSAMDWFGTAAAARRSGDWERLLGRWRGEVPRASVDRCLSVLSAFGLDSLYGDGAMPQWA